MLTTQPTIKGSRLAILINLIFTSINILIGYLYPEEDEQSQWIYDILLAVGTLYSAYIYTIFHQILKKLHHNSSFKLFFIINICATIFFQLAYYTNDDILIGLTLLILIPSGFILDIKFMLLYKKWSAFLIYSLLDFTAAILSIWLPFKGDPLGGHLATSITDIGTIIILLKTISVLKQNKNWNVDLIE